MRVKAFLDEGGHSGASPVFLIAGYAAPDSVWAGFDVEWREVLNAFGLDHFTMKDFAHRKRAFEGWGEDGRRELLSRLISMINSRDVCAFGAVITHEWFEQHRKSFHWEHLEFPKSPYFLAMQEVAKMGATEICRMMGGEKIDFTFDRQTEFQHSAAGDYIAAQHLFECREQLGDLEYLSGRVAPKLQAADLVAYELRRRVEEPSRKRWAMEQILTNNHLFRCRGFDGAIISGRETTPVNDHWFVARERDRK